MNEIDVIVALLPLAALMVVVQTNLYHALIIRGILGAIAALVYAVLGAADVSLTEALMGTMLAISLYAIAVRSSLLMRVGVLEDEMNQDKEHRHFGKFLDDLKAIFSKRQMRVEVVPYTDTQALEQALMDKEVHAICTPLKTEIRVQRLYDIIQDELSSPETILTYVNTTDSGEEHK